MGIDLIEIYFYLEDEFQVALPEVPDETLGDIQNTILQSLVAKGRPLSADEVWRRMLPRIVEVLGDDPKLLTRDTRIRDLRLD